MSKVAFLGLGAMGSRMVVHLVRVGYKVTAWNRSKGAVDAAAAIGAVPAAVPRDAVDGADFVLSMVSDDLASKAICLDGENPALAGLKAGAIAVEISTVSPDWIKTLSKAVSEKGAELVDAPVAGSLSQAEAGQLAVFAGCTDAAFAKAQPILSAFSGAIYHVGGQGSGIAMKLGVNAMLAAQISAFAEAVSAMQASGIAPQASYDVLSKLPIASPAGNWMGGLMVAQDFAPRFTVDLMAKDLRYAAADAEAHGFKLPLTIACRDLFKTLSERGFGGENVSAAIKAYQSPV